MESGDGSVELDYRRGLKAHELGVELCDAMPIGGFGGDGAGMAGGDGGWRGRWGGISCCRPTSV